MSSACVVHACLRLFPLSASLKGLHKELKDPLSESDCHSGAPKRVVARHNLHKNRGQIRAFMAPQVVQSLHTL